VFTLKHTETEENMDGQPENIMPPVPF